MTDWLAPAARNLPPSATLAINEHSNALIAAGRQVYKLGLGQSPFPVPPTVVAALKAHAHEKDYLPVRGLPALRQAIVDHAERHLGLRYSPDLVLVGPGSKELIFQAQLVLDVEVVIPSPSWVSYAPQGQLTGRAVRWLPTRRAERWHLDPAVLDAHCRAEPDRHRLMILNYPNNPNGATIPPARLEAIARVAREHQVLIISDEIYGLVDHEGRHDSIARFYTEGTVISSGLSKWCGAGGWRLGAFLFPDQLRWLADAMTAVASETFTAVSAPIQHAAITAYRGGEAIDRYLLHSRRVLSALGRWCATALRQTGYDVDPPEGGFYLFPDATAQRQALGAMGIRTSAELCDRMLEDTGVATLPGTAFGRDPEELTFRLSYVDFDGEAALAASEQQQADLDEAFLRRCCPRVLDAVAAMAAWLPRPAERQA